MPITRRHLLITGTGAGAALLLAACDNANAPAEIGLVETPSPDAAAGAAPAAGDMYDGSPVPPLSDAAIYNPDGLPDRPLGGVGAPVIVVEYISPTCPHCAAFKAQVYPQLAERYIDTGEITFVSRPFMRNVLDAVVFMLAESAETGPAYHEILDTYLTTQNEWAAAENPRQAIFEIAQQFGFTQERFEEILTNQEMFAALDSMREQALNEFGLTGTPSFYINGQKFNGNYTFEALSEAIDAAA